MQIHDLNTKALTDPAYVAFDDGTDTYKVEFNDTVKSAAQAAVAEADLTQNTVGFTSGDSLSPTGWTSVSQITTNSTLATLFNRISTMVKNVRYIWNLLGSSSFSNVASTLTGAIGNTALTTTAQTLSGAIAEHETDISGLNSNMTLKEEYLSFTYNSKIVNIYFRYTKPFMCVLMDKSNEAMSLPTTWTYVGTLTSIKPPSDRYIPFVSANGKSGTLRIYPDGGVRIVGHSADAMWLQTSATCSF